MGSSSFPQKWRHYNAERADGGDAAARVFFIPSYYALKNRLFPRWWQVLLRGAPPMSEETMPGERVMRWTCATNAHPLIHAICSNKE
jgi:hypothetical protein